MGSNNDRRRRRFIKPTIMKDRVKVKQLLILVLTREMGKNKINK